MKEMMRRWEYFLVPKTRGSLLHLLARGWASLWAEGRHESALVLNRAQSCHSEGGTVPGRPGQRASCRMRGGHRLDILQERKWKSISETSLYFLEGRKKLVLSSFRRPFGLIRSSIKWRSLVQGEKVTALGAASWSA